MNREEQIPVIVGVGQLLDRPSEKQEGLEPLALIKKALRRADEDSGAVFLNRADSIDIVGVASWPYENLGNRIVTDLKLNPRRCNEGDISGDRPVRYLCEAANRIARGESSVSVICGGESSWSVRQAQKQQRSLTTWTQPFQREIDLSVFNSIGYKYGLNSATTIYSLFENACRISWGQTFDQSQRESAQIWANFSKIAAKCEDAWLRNILTPEEIMTPSRENRRIAWPYTKLMVANNFVNGATAMILTNLALAKKAGVPEKQLIYLGAGAYADELTDYLARDRFDHSVAMESVLKEVLSKNNVKANDIDFAEIYSCFPVVPKLARRVLKWDIDKDLTVIGGMNSGGAQLSNFMSQAAVVMIQKLRKSGRNGLLYGNGHFLTHACGLLLSNIRPILQPYPMELSVQNKADKRMEPSPKFVEIYEGPGKVETYTVAYDAEGFPDYGVIVALSPEGIRFLAKIEKEDSEGFNPLIATGVNPIGRDGYSFHKKGFNFWHWK